MRATARGRVADVAGAAGGGEGLAEVLGHLRMAALGALGKSHDALHPGGGLARIPGQKVVDDCPGTGVDREQLDPHRAARVVAPPHDACLLEHPDEDPWVVVASGQLSRVDGAAEIADGPVHLPQIVRPWEYRRLRTAAPRLRQMGSRAAASSLGAPSRPPRPTICT